MDILLRSHTDTSGGGGFTIGEHTIDRADLSDYEDFIRSGEMSFSLPINQFDGLNQQLNEQIYNLYISDIAGATFADQTANRIFVGPTSGLAATPTFRVMVTADIPNSIVTLAKIANIGATTILGNSTGSSAAPSALSAAQVKTLIAPIEISYGGHGQSTQQAGFDALSPLTTLGDLIYANVIGQNTRLPGTTSPTKKFLTQTGTGSVSAVPAWGTISTTDISGLGAVATQGDGDKGDITVSSSGASWNIDSQAVTLGKIQTLTAKRIMGNSSVSSAVPEQIAVGSHFSLVSSNLSFKYFASDFSNNLGTAISGIGSEKCVLQLDADTTCNSAVTIPATMKLDVRPGTVITKSSSGTIAFAGEGLVNPISRHPIFSGFSSGNITWTGNVYPPNLSIDLWADSSWSTRFTNATNAMSGKQVTLEAFPGEFTAQMILLDNQNLHLNAGTYTDNYNTNLQPRFYIGNTCKVYGDGKYRTTINLNTGHAQRHMLFFGKGMNFDQVAGTCHDIEYCDFGVVGTGTTPNDAGQTCLHLGNCINGSIHDIYMKDVAAYGAFCGTNAAYGYYALNCSIYNNAFDNVKGQVFGSTNGEKLYFYNNTVINIFGTSPYTGTLAVVDLEPNHAADRLINVVISDNVIDGRGADTGHFWQGIIVQHNTGGVAENIRVINNTIWGSASPTTQLGTGISCSFVRNSVIENNFIEYAASGIAMSQCNRIYVRGNTMDRCTAGSEALSLASVCDSVFQNNTIDAISAGVDTDHASFTELNGPTITCNTSGTSVTALAAWVHDWWVGRTVNINSVDYVVATVTDTTHFTLTGSAGTQSGVNLITKFGNNRYLGNTANVYTLLNGSRVVNAADRVIHDVLIVAVDGPKDDYQPGPSRHRIEFTADSNWSITGLSWSGSPYYQYPVDGEEHEWYNADTSESVTLKHEDSGSTAARRFYCKAETDVVIAPKRMAVSKYVASLQRWYTWLV